MRATACVVIVVLSLLILPLVEASVSLDSSWAQRTTLPDTIDKGQVTVLNNLIYVVSNNSLYTYDSRSNIWQLQSPVPLPQGGVLNGFGLSACDDKIFLIGDASTNGQRLYINQAYDPLSGSWESKTPPSFSNGIWQTEVAKGKIYIIGGSTGNLGERQVFQTNEVYDPSTNSWSQAAPIPTPVNEYASAVLGDKIYIIGGFNASTYGGMSAPDFTCINLVQIFDPETNQWTQGTPMPNALMSVAACAIVSLQRIYVVGGWDGKYLDKGGTRLDIATSDWNQFYDLQTGAWSIAAPLPMPLRDLCLVNVNGKMYALGGQNSSLSWGTTNFQYIPPDLPTTIEATADNGSSLSLVASGNITADQIWNTVLSSNQSAGNTVLSFNVTGVSGDFGFQNVTVPKSVVTIGTAPVVYIDGVNASEQCFCEDADNYYVWYSIHFSTYEIAIVFASPTPINTPTAMPTLSSTTTAFPTNTPFVDGGWSVPLWVYVATAIGVIASVSVVVLITKKRKKAVHV